MRVSILIYILTILAGIANAQQYALVNKVVASDRAANNNYGWSTAISDEYALVGAPFKGFLKQQKMQWDAGQVYIVKKNSKGIWKEVQKIDSGDSIPFQWFGTSVGIYGEYVVVGADGDGNNDKGQEQGRELPLFLKEIMTEGGQRPKN